ncbi:MAG: amino acid ABC transporter permease [bacterium]|nr:amino acid ABC transporter permease [bacterium]
MYHFSVSTMLTAVPFILAGVPMTLWISFAALAIGVLIGLPVGALRTTNIRAVDTLLGVYVEVFRNTPVLVQIVWFYYVLPILLHVNLGAVDAGILALGLNTSAYLAEIFRGGILGIASGQTEAALSLGFTGVGTMRFVVLPQVTRKMLAPFVNQFVVLVKDSALVAYIGVLDIMHRGDVVTVQSSRPLEVYTTVAIAYFTLCFAASRLMRWIEVRFAVPG